LRRAPSRARTHIYIMRPGLRIWLVSPHPAPIDTPIANEDARTEGNPTARKKRRNSWF